MENTHENLNESITASYRQHQRDIAIKALANRPNLTMAQISKLLEHKEHGPIIATLQLEDLFQYWLAQRSPKEESKAPVVTAPAIVVPAPPVEVVATTTTPVVEAIPTEVKTTEGGKNRIDRTVGYKEIKAALQSKSVPMAISEVVSLTGYEEAHARTLLKELCEAGEIQPIGAGRGRKYAMA
jgi:hypothetical protein